jgi:hypothetical protein
LYGWPAILQDAEHGKDEPCVAKSHKKRLAPFSFSLFSDFINGNPFQLLGFAGLSPTYGLTNVFIMAYGKNQSERRMGDPNLPGYCN